MSDGPRKVFVFALPRSGSTLLCDLLTVPGKSVVLHEPMILRRFGDGREQRICQAMSRLGIEVEHSPEHFVRGKLALPWYGKHVIPHFSQYEFWGLKEVYLSDAEQLVDQFDPERLILLWRDPRDVALSFIELMNRSLMSYSDRRTLKDEAWALECLRASAETLGRLARNHPHLMVRYEQLIESAGHRRSILEFVGLSEFGQSRIAMVEDAMGIRNAEVQKHKPGWSSHSVDRWLKEPLGWRRTFAMVCHGAMQPYAAEVGYGDAELSADQFCAATTAAPEQRVSDPEYQPAIQFDFAYARRRARKKVAGMLSAGSTVLDVGASVAALQFMVEHSRVVAVDDGSPGKCLLSRRWRDGVLPSLDSFDTVTFLFSLEYTNDPLRMIRGLLQRGLRIIISYHCSDDLSLEQRKALAFDSHLSRQNWANFAACERAEFSCEWIFDGFQSLICLQPRRVTA